MTYLVLLEAEWELVLRKKGKNVREMINNRFYLLCRNVFENEHILPLRKSLIKSFYENIADTLNLGKKFSFHDVCMRTVTKTSSMNQDFSCRQEKQSYFVNS